MDKKVLTFIHNGWDACIKENRQDNGTLIGLPYPYTVPAVGYFDEMYYWDTYFTNLGLILDGRLEQARYNVDNMCFLIRKYGYMPNGNRTYYLSRSQPPFLSQMVREVYEQDPDPRWLRDAYAALDREYQFWTTQRAAPMGLSHYDDLDFRTHMEDLVQGFAQRIGVPAQAATEQTAHHYVATCESGWDITPRWEMACYDYAPVDLNSLLFLLESNMAYFAEILENGEAAVWQQRAQQRRNTMVTHMKTPEGLLTDYNFVTGRHSPVLSAAVFYPLFCGLADADLAQAVVQNLPRLEAEHGILTCEKWEGPGSFQWGYPNGWACLQYVAIAGLDRYGYGKEARRIAEKYVHLVETVFEATGNLWEKYNVVEGNIQVANEYGLPAMMGWSAGVYLAAKNHLKQ